MFVASILRSGPGTREVLQGRGSRGSPCPAVLWSSFPPDCGFCVTRFDDQRAGLIALLAVLGLLLTRHFLLQSRNLLKSTSALSDVFRLLFA